MLSHILGFKGLQGPDLFFSTPQHHLPPLFALGNALGQSSAASLFLPEFSFSVQVGGRWVGLGWGEGGPGPFPALLPSHQDMVLTAGLEERVLPWSWVPEVPVWASCCPMLLHSPGSWRSTDITCVMNLVCLHPWLVKTKYWTPLYNLGPSMAVWRFLHKH